MKDFTEYIKLNPNGNYKLIFIYNSIPNKKKYNYFKDLINNKIIEITTEFNINNFEYGDNYDLNLYKEYRGLNWKYDIIENKQSNLTKVILLKKREENIFNCQTENGNIIDVRMRKKIVIPDFLIGKSILVEKYPKFLGEVYEDNMKLIKLNFKLNETPIINNLDISRQENNKNL